MGINASELLVSTYLQGSP